MKKFLDKDALLFLIIIGILCGIIWYRTDKHYDKVLEGTKYQILKKDPRVQR